ncbi:MAG: CHAP domain-containing protein [Eubacteriales bacterium]|nr:CHAP domain-containing protein [Eubacteriales bacterium]
MARYNDLSRLARLHKQRAVLRKLFATVACLVVFVTTYMLILPALTLETELICNVEEHKHGDSCYTTSKNLICGEEESEGHSHSSSCYSTNKVLVCNDESEEHTHTDSCYKEEKELVCGQQEYTGHKHGSSCYEEVKELTCKKKEHSHTDGCYKKKEEATTQGTTEQKAVVQDQTTEEVSTEATTEEKVEGDPNADLETAADWKRSVSGVELTGNWADDLVAIAKSQKGYTESSKNYIVENDGTKKGYTRYGAWYGDPYGDWCAMFVSFCLDYAHIGTDYFPQASECTKYIELLKSMKLYHSASSDYEVKAGDIIFFDNGSKKLSDHVGIVTKVTDDTIYTIEGNHGDAVGTEDYARNAGKIVGYGELPENPAMVKEEGTTEATTEKV